MKQKDKIEELIKKCESFIVHEDSAGEHSIFDIETVIEVFRQQEETLGEAEALAESSKNYNLLVQIIIENRHDE